MVLKKTAFLWLHALFFVSGFPALLYQIVWQRALFAIYGVNIESVTVVVSAFMLGLGLGSVVGGWLSQRNTPLLVIFALMEFSVALFGVISLGLFRWVASFTAGAPTIETGVITLGLILAPTILMGATLPVLVAYLVGFTGNVGRSVGSLYFVNTLGSAAACLLAAEVTMRKLGMSGSASLAAGLNTFVAIAVLWLYVRGRSAAAIRETELSEKRSAGLVALPVAATLAAITGFISLCQEIVWYRVYSFASGGSPKSFANVLAAFLAGIALGSLAARRICRDTPGAPLLLRRIAVLVVAANLLGFLTVPLVAFAVRYVDAVITLPLIALTAGLLGATFPLLNHIAVPSDRRAGAGLSWLYLSNIAGSALGSFLVGFVLMDLWNLETIELGLAILGVAVAVTLWMAGRPARFGRLVAAAAGVTLCIGLMVSCGPLYAAIYEQLQNKSAYRRGERFTDIVETRSGVITVDADRTIYGGGVYDGKLITDVTETDALLRPYSISFLHPDPKEVLIIGLAGGAWAEVIANHPQVERVVVVEINPGYLTVIRRYPDVAPVLSNPKVEIFIDDGRRWLMRFPRRKYDLIVMDTIYHWRAHATNLLSCEFLELARRHLKPGGILYYNTTHSGDVQLTGVTAFPYALRFGPLLAVSDSPIQTDKDRWRRMLLAYRLEGATVFDHSDPDDRERLNEIIAYADTLQKQGYDPSGMETAESIRRRCRTKRIITDDNMASEWTR
ncbi:MAG: fused MFS/spermidine synthase [Acidobacteriia bacterium]|nr:fused MFS/spermidine synthase [Terriglobia bacterium]